jgi:hypothetical protein
LVAPPSASPRKPQSNASYPHRGGVGPSPRRVKKPRVAVASPGVPPGPTQGVTRHFLPEMEARIDRAAERNAA